MYWIVIATAVRRTPQGTITHQIPTFYLNGDIQGITPDTVEKVAKDIIDPFGELEVHVCANTVFELPEPIGDDMPPGYDDGVLPDTSPFGEG